MYGIIGVVVGFVVGYGLAVLGNALDRREADRQRALPPPLPVARLVRVESLAERRRRIATSGFTWEEPRG